MWVRLDDVYSRRVNPALRDGDRVYMSPRYAGSKQQWQLEAEDFLVVDLEGNIQAGSGQISRESAVHLAVYQQFPAAGVQRQLLRPGREPALANLHQPFAWHRPDFDRHPVHPCQ